MVLEFFWDVIFYSKILLLVKDASHDFYGGYTTIPSNNNEMNGRKQVTNILCQTISPEEKRKIIGDTFIQVIYLFHKILIIPIELNQKVGIDL